MGSKALPPYAALRAFAAVGRHGGIRKAALALGVDHAVVSRHLKQLDKWLGVALTFRVNGETRLSDAGLRYHTRISAAFAELEAATVEIAGSNDWRRMKVWCVPGLATQWLSDRLGEFLQCWPEYEIELRPSDERPDLLRGDADVDVRFFGDTWPPYPGGRGLRFIELARPKLMAVISPVLAAKLEGMESPRQLLELPLLHEEHDLQWKAWLRSNGVHVDSKLPGQVLWHAHLAIAAAKKGRGVALASSYLVQREFEEGSLIEFTGPSIRAAVVGSYNITTREESWFMPAIARFRSFLLAKAADPDHTTSLLERRA